MSIHDKICIKFHRFMAWVTDHKQPSCDECREWIRHCECVARGTEEVKYK